MKIGGYLEVVLEGGVGVFPDAEEVDLAAGLLALLAVVVRSKGKRTIRFRGLASRLAPRLPSR